MLNFNASNHYLLSMKRILVVLPLILLAIKSNCQEVPKPADPCMKLDTNNIKQLIIGNWVDISDTNHKLVIIFDSIEETASIGEGIHKKVDVSYWNYHFTDNIFGTDVVTCYSLIETKVGYPHPVKYAINSIDANYMLLGAEGKWVYRRKK